MAFSLDKNQLAELQHYRQEARQRMVAQNATIEASLAGTALSENGPQKLLDMMETFYQQFESAAERMPQEFDFGVSPDVLATVDSTAVGYLFFDNYRPNMGWALSSKKRAAIAQYNEIMDARAWKAVLYLKQARAYLPAK